MDRELPIFTGLKYRNWSFVEYFSSPVFYNLCKSGRIKDAKMLLYQQHYYDLSLIIERNNEHKMYWDQGEQN